MIRQKSRSIPIENSESIIIIFALTLTMQARLRFHVGPILWRFFLCTAKRRDVSRYWFFGCFFHMVYQQKNVNKGPSSLLSPLKVIRMSKIRSSMVYSSYLFPTQVIGLQELPSRRPCLSLNSTPRNNWIFFLIHTCHNFAHKGLVATRRPHSHHHRVHTRKFKPLSSTRPRSGCKGP